MPLFKKRAGISRPRVVNSVVTLLEMTGMSSDSAHCKGETAAMGRNLFVPSRVLDQGRCFALLIFQVGV